MTEVTSERVPNNNVNNITDVLIVHYLQETNYSTQLVHDPLPFTGIKGDISSPKFIFKNLINLIDLLLFFSQVVFIMFLYKDIEY